MRYVSVSANISYGHKGGLEYYDSYRAAFGEVGRQGSDTSSIALKSIASTFDVRERTDTNGHIDCRGLHNHGLNCISIFSGHRECKEEGYNVGGTQLNRQAFVS